MTKSIKLAMKKIEELRGCNPIKYLDLKNSLLMGGIQEIINKHLTLNERFVECLSLFLDGMEILPDKEIILNEIIKNIIF
ncbi:hypothetical protein [Bacillus cereus group sp. BfR-BA-01349]|uniref:hypothetical protein n=1 Tax=Bacillus cereus group sp. BfR-BA-01349 TaxID=2920312 RepID=UPI001F5A2DC0